MRSFCVNGVWMRGVSQVFGVCRSFSGGTMWRRLYPNVTARWGSFTGAFAIPGVREFSLCCGCLDASRGVLTRTIQRGENVMLLPGGEKEMCVATGSPCAPRLGSCRTCTA